MVAATDTANPFTGILAEIKNRMKNAVLSGEQIQQEKSDQVMQSAATGEPVSFQDRLRVFVQLEKWRRELDELLELCKSEAEKASRLLMEDFAAAGIQKTTLDGLTVFVKTDRYVNKVAEITQASLCEVLKQQGLGYLVAEGYNAQKLKSWVLGKLDEKEEIPEQIQAALKIGEVSRLATVKA